MKSKKTWGDGGMFLGAEQGRGNGSPDSAIAPEKTPQITWVSPGTPLPGALPSTFCPFSGFWVERRSW